MKSVAYRFARPEDRAAVEALLVAEELPLDGLAEHFASFVLAVDGDRVVGAAGLEVHDAFGLLRSVVVAPEAKGRGIGQELSRRVLRAAEERGLAGIYLLTMTAAEFFPRLGFRRVRREDVPLPLQASEQFTSACPASAIAMRYQPA
jgi:amino-acid N-acetyltransferase